MVGRICLSAGLFFTACSQPFVMKTKFYSRPVMVGEVRQIGGQKMPPDAQTAAAFSTEIEILDTPTSSSSGWQEKQEFNLENKLTAATVMGDRDAQISELKVGSYVFNAVLFYFDKDWIRLSGHSVPRIFIEPERKYHLYFAPQRGQKGKKEKPKKEKRPKRSRR